MFVEWMGLTARASLNLSRTWWPNVAIPRFAQVRVELHIFSTTRVGIISISHAYSFSPIFCHSHSNYLKFATRTKLQYTPRSRYCGVVYGITVIRVDAATLSSD